MVLNVLLWHGLILLFSFNLNLASTSSLQEVLWTNLLILVKLYVALEILQVFCIFRKSYSNMPRASTLLVSLGSPLGLTDFLTTVEKPQRKENSSLRWEICKEGNLSEFQICSSGNHINLRLMLLKGYIFHEDKIMTFIQYKGNMCQLFYLTQELMGDQ